MKQLSENFSLEEFTRSNTAIKYGVDNTPSAKNIEALQYLVDCLLQPLRELYGKPMSVNSGFRCERLNNLVNGARTSQHKKGEAGDIACDSPVELVECLKRSGLPFDQCGIYKTFVHLSLKQEGTNRRKFFNGKY